MLKDELDSIKFLDEFKEGNKKTNLYGEGNMPIEKNIDWSTCNNYENLRSIYFDDRISEDININETQVNIEEEKVSYYDSKTPSAKQIAWKTPTEFPLCPLSCIQPSLEEYAANLKIGEVVTKNENCEHIIDDFRLVNDRLYIRSHATSEQIKPYSLMTVYLENGFFCHAGTLFWEEVGVEKYFLKAVGEDYTDEEVFDDWC